MKDLLVKILMWIIMLAGVVLIIWATVAAFRAEEEAAKWIVMFCDLAVVIFVLWQWKGITAWFKPKKEIK